MQTTKRLSVVDAALALDEVSTDYQVELRPDQAFEFVGKARDYNNFTQSDLERLVVEVNDQIPTMQFGEGNPNNGKPHHVFKIGNEGSRVIYVTIHKTYLNQWTNKDYDNLTTALERIAKKANADEFHVTENTGRNEIGWAGTYTARFWWD